MKKPPSKRHSAARTEGRRVSVDDTPEHDGEVDSHRVDILLDLAGCCAFDVLQMLKHQQQPVVDCVVDVTATPHESKRKVFTDIHLRYTVTGRGLSADMVAYAIESSNSKYCSNSPILRHTARLSHDWRIVECRTAVA